MIETSGGKRSSAFSRWLRTDKPPPTLGPDGLELKFNPWHDPANGRFTFADTGRRYRAGGTDAVGGERSRVPAHAGRAPVSSDRSMSQTSALPKAGTSHAVSAAGDSQRSAKRALLKMQPLHIDGSRPGNPTNPAIEFVGGVGEGLYDVGKGTVAGVHAALTTNPATTVRNAGLGIEDLIDAAIAAEDTPAHIQVSGAVSAVANASARDVGRATGTVAGNVALAAAPGAALSKVVALR